MSNWRFSEISTKSNQKGLISGPIEYQSAEISSVAKVELNKILKFERQTIRVADMEGGTFKMIKNTH